MTFNFSAEDLDSQNTPWQTNFSIIVFDWDSYRPWHQSGLAGNISTNNGSILNFTCVAGIDYILRVTNHDLDDMRYNFSIITDNNVPIHSIFTENEQNPITGKISVAYYLDTDPWLFDSPSTTYRSTIMFGYDPIYGSNLRTIAGGGERYFTVKNVDDHPITLFMGANPSLHPIL